MQLHFKERASMAIETERKFLVRNDSWKAAVHESIFVRQGFLSAAPERTVRVRTTGKGAFLTVKGKAVDASRQEFEYPIPASDAEELLQLCEGVIIKKKRHYVHHKGHLWEIDAFQGENEGLVLAEIELKKADEYFERPDWAAEEVTGDYRYQNSALASNPFRNWKK